MKVGDLVKRKPKWGEWTKHNPWMLSDRDLEIGIVVEKGVHYTLPELEICSVLWPVTGKCWEEIDNMRVLRRDCLKDNSQD